MGNDSNRFEYEASSLEWYYEEQYLKGTDYRLKEDPDFLAWVEKRQEADRLYQMRDTHEVES